MKTINVRELRALIPGLKEELAAEHELLLVSNGEPVARIVPLLSTDSGRKKLTSMKAFRDTMPTMKVPSEVLIREDRDRR
jgi:antitoxin (DNA-binding transcriptional repressor) of toxin-antitoxin stability system